jgi:hypothetical protein
MGPTIRIRIAALGVALLALGCSVNAIAPINTPSGPVTVTLNSRGIPIDAQPVAKEVGLVDLSPGRVTRVDYVVRTRMTPAGQPPSDWSETRFARVLTIMGEETPVAGGETYRVEESIDPEHPENVLRHDLWRQDKAGLFNFQADLAPSAMRLTAGRLVLDDPARAAQVARALAVVEAKRAAIQGRVPRALARRGPLPEEITFLRYPLHPNASWDGRPGFNVWYFEGWEDLATPAGPFRAARVRIDVPGQLGPNDVVQAWWAAPGETQRHYHIFADLEDETGQVTGTFEADETFVVTSYETQPL